MTLYNQEIAIYINNISDIHREHLYNNKFGSDDEIKNTVIARVRSLLVDELQKKELASFLYKDTWVYSIQSTLRWPNKLEVKLKEHQPLANWKNQGIPDCGAVPGRALEKVQIQS